MKLQRIIDRQKKQNDDKKTCKKTRYSSGGASFNNSSCFFCGSNESNLHQVTTFILDKRVRESALKLEDTVLLAKLSVGDLISQEAVYHNKCLVSLYNRADRLDTVTDISKKNRENEGIALAELISYIEETKQVSIECSVFKLSDLVKLYSDRLTQLGYEIVGKIHSTQLKNRILANIPDLQAHKQGRHVLLVFEDDIGSALKTVQNENCDDEAIILAKASKIVRRDMLQSGFVFDGKFEANVQKESVSPSLLYLVSMILRGSNIEMNSQVVRETQTALTLSQLLLYNSTFRQASKQSAKITHMRSRETPLPVFVGMLIHAKTRKKGLINKLFELGLSIPYNRVIELSEQLGSQVISRFEKENVVYPTNLKKTLFTTSAVDNIDHNPSSTTASDSLHGTAISLFQYPSFENEGLIVNESVNYEAKKRKLILPDDYANVPPIIMPKDDPVVPPSYAVIKQNAELLKESSNSEKRLVLLQHFWML